MVLNVFECCFAVKLCSGLTATSCFMVNHQCCLSHTIQQILKFLISLYHKAVKIGLWDADRVKAVGGVCLNTTRGQKKSKWLTSCCFEVVARQPCRCRYDTFVHQIPCMCIKLATGAVIKSIEKCSFLLPQGGAITITEYWHISVFRPGLLSNKFRSDSTLYCKVIQVKLD